MNPNLRANSAANQTGSFFPYKNVIRTPFHSRYSKLIATAPPALSMTHVTEKVIPFWFGQKPGIRRDGILLGSDGGFLS